MSSAVTSEPAPVVEDESSGSLRSRVDLGVFIPAAAITVVFLIWGIVSNESLTAVTGAILDFLIGDIGWVYVLAVCGFVAICVFLAFSRYGHVRLGKDDDRPEFRTASWISMMFAAGMGIGLLFYGVAEPISHLAAPPPGLADAKTEEAARIAMQYTFLHWGITGGRSTPSRAWPWPISATGTAGATC